MRDNLFLFKSPSRATPTRAVSKASVTRTLTVVLSAPVKTTNVSTRAPSPVVKEPIAQYRVMWPFAGVPKEQQEILSETVAGRQGSKA